MFFSSLIPAENRESEQVDADPLDGSLSLIEEDHQDRVKFVTEEVESFQDAPTNGDTDITGHGVCPSNDDTHIADVSNVVSGVLSAGTEHRDDITSEDTHNRKRNSDIENISDDDNDDNWSTAEEDTDEESTIDEGLRGAEYSDDQGQFTEPARLAETTDIVTCEGLIQQLKKYRRTPSSAEGHSSESESVDAPRKDEHSEHTFTIGLVGYPNVGKSSLINRVLGEKKVSVSATPGKTKHFQTIRIEPDVFLCDCPGLVMPSFALSRAQMVCLGILPIDQMRDPTAAIQLICSQVPRALLERVYGIVLPAPSEGENPKRDPTPAELLTVYAYNRGFMGPKGTTDWGRAGRIILKDYLNGRLRYCYPPPGCEEAVFNAELRRLGEILEEGQLEKRAKAQPNLVSMARHRLLASDKGSKLIDSRFFRSNEATYHVKSSVPLALSNSSAAQNTSSGQLESGNGASNIGASTLSLQGREKGWKKHNNRNKKEKLRRINRDLDYS